MKRLLICLLMVAVSTVFGADISGKWKASFDTQIGVQNYTYEFKLEGGKLTGTAQSEHGKSALEQGAVSGDTVTFVENLEFQGNKIAVEYKGTVAGDEIKFTRKVGDFATEELVAKRVKE
ncbi:MAG TPA: hypothetical protein VER03_14570 [Bryobacteraceae bacterium]|nr:hypothetical protein [Bryobacteraceae bacterium]